MSFSTLCQKAVTSEAYVSLPLDKLLEASANASTAQYPLNRTKVNAIVKSFAKGNPLLIAPKLCEYEGVLHTIGGRHRTAAIDEFTKLYGVNAKGAFTLITEVNRAELTPIERVVTVDMLTCNSRETLAALILADNESRTTSAPERAAVRAEGGYATAGDKFKLRFMPFLAANLSLSDEGGTPITVTAITLAQIAGKLATAIKNLVNATDEQLNTVAGHLNEYLNSDDCALPTKFAQHYAPFIVEFLTNPVEAVDEDGDAIINYDADGHEVSVTYAQYMQSELPTVEKKAKAPKKASIDADKFAAMEAKLAELGYTV